MNYVISNLRIPNQMYHRVYPNPKCFLYSRENSVNTMDDANPLYIWQHPKVIYEKALKKAMNFSRTSFIS